MSNPAATFLDNARRRHISRTGTLLWIVVIAGMVFMLVPLGLIVADRTRDARELRDVCAQQRSLDYDLFKSCMVAAGFPLSCDQIKDDRQFRACPAASDACTKTSVVNVNVDVCVGQKHNETLVRAGAFALVPSLILVLGLVLRFRTGPKLQRLAKLTVPGEVVQVRTHGLRKPIESLPASKRIVLHLLFKNGEWAELSTTKGEAFELLQAILELHPAVDIGDLIHFAVPL